MVITGVGLRIKDAKNRAVVSRAFKPFEEADSSCLDSGGNSPYIEFNCGRWMNKSEFHLEANRIIRVDPQSSITLTIQIRSQKESEQDEWIWGDLLIEHDGANYVYCNNMLALVLYNPIHETEPLSGVEPVGPPVRVLPRRRVFPQ